MADRDPPRATATRQVWATHPGYVMAWTVNTAAALYLGGTGVLMAPSRFASPTYDGLRDSLGVTGWSALILGYGVVLLVVARLPTLATMVAFWTGGFAYLTIGIYFGMGLPDPHASPWGPGVFALLGAWQFTQAEAYRQSRRATLGPGAARGWPLFVRRPR